MFNNNIVKMKKELFVEAESIAYLVNNVLKRKLAFANTVTLMAFHKYMEKNNYEQEITTKLNLFTIPAIAEKFGISDIYVDNLRIEVRASLDGKVFPIPKIQIENSLVADYIVVFKGTKNPLKCEALGYMTKEDLIFDAQDDDYYYIANSLLNPLDELKETLANVNVESKTFYETEHKVTMENFGAFIDGDLDDVKAIDLIKHVLDCPECRAYLVEYNYLEDILRGIKHYPEIEEQYLSETEDNDSENINIAPEVALGTVGVADGMLAGEVALGDTINEVSDDVIDINDDFVEDAPSEESEQIDLAEENIDLAEGEDVFEINENPSDDNQEGQEDNIIDFSDETLAQNDESDDTNEPALEIIDENPIDIIEENIANDTDNSDFQQVDTNEADNIIDINAAPEEQTISDIQIEGSIFDKDSNSPIEIEDFPIDTNENENTEMNYYNDDMPNENNEKAFEEYETPEINFHELYTNNLSGQDFADFETQNEEIFATKETDTITTNENTAEKPVDSEKKDNIIADIIDKIQSKNINKKFIIAVAGVVLFLIVGIATINLSKGGNNNATNGATNKQYANDGGARDINETLTNTFKDTQYGGKVSKISWEVEEALSKNPDAAEYLTLIGQTIGDNIDTSMQDILLSNSPQTAKVLIKVNKTGEVAKVIFAESSGSQDLDNAIEQGIKSAFESTAMTKYVSLQKDTNLIILVNF